MEGTDRKGEVGADSVGSREGEGGARGEGSEQEREGESALEGGRERRWKRGGRSQVGWGFYWQS